MSIWTELLPRDIRNHISSYLDQYNKYYPVINYKKYLIKYVAIKNDTYNDIKYMTNLQQLYCNDNTNFTDEGIKNLTNLQELYCSISTNFTDEGIKQLNNQILYLYIFFINTQQN